MADNKNRQALSEENLDNVAGGKISMDKKFVYVIDEKSNEIVGKFKNKKKGLRDAINLDNEVNKSNDLTRLQ